MRRREPEPVRITSASRSHSADIKGRQKRYLISMGIRTLCFVLAVLTRTLFGGHWMMWVFLAGAVFLPYVAVVMANAGTAPDPAGPDYSYRPDMRAIGDRPADRPSS